MLYVIALFVPPLPLLLIGKPISAIINGIFWLLGIVLAFFGIGFIILLACFIHAFVVISRKRQDERDARLMGAMQAGRR